MKTIKLSEIKVPESFKNSIPNPEKIQKVFDYVKENGKLDRPIVLHNDTIVDNYIRYIVACAIGLTEVPYISKQEYHKELYQSDKINYVVGVFYNCNKEYTWKNPKGIPVNVGDKVLVYSKDKYNKKSGTSVITVVNTYNSTNQKLLRHKNIIRIVKHAKE